MSNKFKMPSKFKKVSTVSSIRKELIATGDQLCIGVAKNMRDASIKEIQFNLVQTKHAWEMTLQANPTIDKKEIAQSFVNAMMQQNKNERAQQMMSYSCMMLIGGDVREFTKKTMVNTKNTQPTGMGLTYNGPK